MDKELNEKDLEFILVSLDYTKKSRVENNSYPNEEFRQASIAEVEKVIEKVRLLKKTFKEF